MKSNLFPLLRHHARRALCVGALLVVAGVAQADVISMSTLPTPPRANQPFDLVVVADACDAVPGYAPPNRTIETVGSEVTVTVEYIVPLIPPNGGCFGEEFTYTWRLDPLPAGPHTITLRSVDETGEFFSDLSEIAVQVAPFRAPVPTVVPATHPWLLALMGLGLLVLAWRRR